jgi:translation initiation factor 2 gamma subunit (eIF-2gamma)
LQTGKYNFEFLLFNPEITKSNNRIFEIEIIDTNNQILAHDKIDLYERRESMNDLLHIKYFISNQQEQKLYMRLIPVKGNILLNEMVISPNDE